MLWQSARSITVHYKQTRNHSISPVPLKQSSLKIKPEVECRHQRQTEPECTSRQKETNLFRALVSRYHYEVIINGVHAEAYTAVEEA